MTHAAVFKALTPGPENKGGAGCYTSSSLKVMINILLGNATHNIVNIVHDAQQVSFGRLFACLDLHLAGIV